MSHTISVRLDDPLYDKLNDIAAVLNVRLSALVRTMLEEKAGEALVSEQFHAKLAERQQALARLHAYAPPTTLEDAEQDVLAPLPDNGAGPDLSPLVE